MVITIGKEVEKGVWKKSKKTRRDMLGGGKWSGRQLQTNMKGF